MLNPYYDKNFFTFFSTLISRFFHGFSGGFAPDEIQLFVLICVAISSAFVGTFLILRKMSMLANSLSHTILLGIALAFVLSKVSDPHLIANGTLLLAALVTGFVTAYLTEFLTKTVKLQEDASVGIVFTTFFALGVILLTLMTRNAHLGIEAVMGNVDALHLKDCKLVFFTLCVNLALFFLLFKEYKITTFDPQLAKVLGISTVFFNYLLMAQMSLGAIAAFRAVGVLMVLAFITAPPLTARFLSHRLKTVLLLASIFGSVCSLVAVALSRHILSVYGVALSTGGLVVVVMFILFLSVFTFKGRVGYSIQQ
jgi:manganese/zinc/iron transport system permease protein